MACMSRHQHTTWKDREERDSDLPFTNTGTPCLPVKMNPQPGVKSQYWLLGSKCPLFFTGHSINGQCCLPQPYAEEYNVDIKGSRLWLFLGFVYWYTPYSHWGIFAISYQDWIGFLVELLSRLNQYVNIKYNKKPFFPFQYMFQVSDLH